MSPNRNEYCKCSNHHEVKRVVITAEARAQLVNTIIPKYLHTYMPMHFHTCRHTGICIYQHTHGPT